MNWRNGLLSISVVFLTTFLALPAGVLAWSPPSVAGICDGNAITWTVSASEAEDNYEMEGSFSSDFAETFSFTLNPDTRTAILVRAAAEGTTLHVRYSSDPDATGSATAAPCPTPTPTHPTPTPTRPSTTPPPTDMASEIAADQYLLPGVFVGLLILSVLLFFARPKRT